MCQFYYRIFFSLTSFVLLVNCQSSQENEQLTDSTKSINEIVAYYEGNLETSEYDSIVNQLTLYKNETFTLHQVDHIAEHRLHSRDHTGIYSYLSDSTQLGLYSNDGFLMLRFLLMEDGMIPLTTGGETIPDSKNIWRLNEINIH